MTSFRSLQSLKKKFFEFDDVEEFHYELMNIVMLVREKHEEGGFYCYCDKYRGCCLFPLIKRCFRQRRLRFCALCKLQTFVTNRTQWTTCPLGSFQIETAKTCRNSNS